MNVRHNSTRCGHRSNIFYRRADYQQRFFPSKEITFTSLILSSCLMTLALKPEASCPLVSQVGILYCQRVPSWKNGHMSCSPGADVDNLSMPAWQYGAATFARSKRVIHNRCRNVSRPDVHAHPAPLDARAHLHADIYLIKDLVYTSELAHSHGLFSEH
jgi:hypothetical protein